MLVPLSPKPSEYKNNLFLLKVFGASMTKAGIEDGNFVVIRSSDTLIDGAIMAVKFNGVSLIKKVRLDKHNVKLFNEDGSKNSITTSIELVEPQGIVLGTLKNFV